MSELRWIDLFGIDPNYTGDMCTPCFLAWSRDELEDMCDKCRAAVDRDPAIDALLERDSIAVAHDPQHTPAARALVDLVDPPPAELPDRVLDRIENRD